MKDERGKGAEEFRIATIFRSRHMKTILQLQRSCPQSQEKKKHNRARHLNI